MRRLIAVTIGLLLSTIYTSSASAQSGDDDGAIRALIETWRHASERADPPTIDRLLAPDYHLSRPNGVRTSREETMQNVRRDSAAIAESRRSDGRQNEITYSDIVVRQYDDFAVVTYHSHYKTLLHPGVGESDYETMRALRRRDGNWRIVDGHGFFIPRTCPDPKSP